MSGLDPSRNPADVELGDTNSARILITDSQVNTNQGQQEPAQRRFTFSDRIQNVIRDLVPLYDYENTNHHFSHASLSRIQNSAPSSTLRSFMAAQNADVIQVQTGTTVNLGPGTHTFGASPTANERSNNTDGASGDYTTSPTEVISVPPTSNANQNQENGRRGRENMLQHVPEYIQLRNIFIRYSPFYIILLIKFVYDHRQGLITFATLYITFMYSNNVVKEELGKQANRSVSTLMTQMVCTIVCNIIIMLFFDQGSLLNNLKFSLPFPEAFDMWNLLWLVVLTDFVLKLITVDVKIILTSLPAKVVPFKSRGKIYLFIEATSQLYRSIVPIQPWLFYLMEIYGGSDKNMAMFLSVGYLICKGIDVISRLRFFKHAFVKLLQSVNLGMKPSADQMQTAGEYCPICQDNYVTPVRLKCGHIFCESCVAVWLDREHTCPLCRANVSDDPAWRDGSTTQFVQVY